MLLYQHINIYFQVKEIQMCTEQYLSSFENSKVLLNLAPQILKDLKTMYTQLHEDWARDVQVITLTIRYFKLVKMVRNLKLKQNS